MLASDPAKGGRDKKERGRQYPWCAPNFVKRLVDFKPKGELMEIAGRIAKLDWHVVIYFEAVDLPELMDFFTSLPTTIVVDHMGRPDVTKPVDGRNLTVS